LKFKVLYYGIKQVMSLSGLSGILAGVYALVGFFIAYRIYPSVVFPGLTVNEAGQLEPEQLEGIRALFYAFTGGVLHLEFAIIGIIILIFAIGTGVFLTIRKAKKHNEKIWDPSSRRLLINFAIPLVTGGVFCMILLQYGLIGLVAPCTLIFYGLALINASKFTLGDIKYLGLVNVIIGLVSTQYIGFGLYFWALGFGVLHIFYGALMYFKYDRK